MHELPAKLSPPRIARIWPRARIRDAIDRSVARSIWITGAAGSGKSCAALDWVSTGAGDVCWYRTDASDADPAVLLAYLANFIQHIRSDESRLPALDGIPIASIDPFVGSFSECFFEALGHHGVLVLDDVHAVDTPEIWEGVLAAVVSRVPNSCRVILLSRQPPPAALARLVLSESLVHIDSRAMQLTAAESIEFAEFRWGEGTLDRTQGERLHETTRGWLAGICLLDIARFHSVDESNAPLPRTSLQYLREEIYGHLDASARSVLVAAAQLDVVPMHAVDGLLDIDDARAIFETLAEQSDFVYSIDRDGLRYTLHPLLREFLRQVAATELAKQEYAEMLERAARIARQTGQSTRAAEIMHALEDWSSLAGLIAAEAPSLLRDSQLATLQSWFSLLPKSRLEADPGLMYFDALTKLGHAPTLALRRLEQCAAKLGEPHDNPLLYLASAAAVHAVLHEGRDLAQMAPWVQRLARWRPRGDSPLEIPIHEGRVYAALFWRVPAERRIAWTHSAREAMARYPEQSSPIWNALLVYFNWRGELGEAERVISYEYTRHHGHRNLANRLALLFHTMASAWMRFEPERGMRAAREGVELLDQWGLEIWRELIHAVAAHIHIDAGDLDGAEPYLARLRQRERESGSTFARGAAACYHGLSALLRDDLNSAWESFERARNLADALDYRVAGAGMRLGMIVVALLRDELDPAERLLIEVEVIRDELGHPFLGFTASLFRTELDRRRGAPVDRVVHLAQATMNIGARHGLHTTAMYHAETLSNVCAMALRGAGPHDHTRTMIRRRGLLPPDDAEELALWPKRIRIHVLDEISISHDLNVQVATDHPPTELTGTPRAILLVLIALGGREVPETRLLAHLPGEGRKNDRAWLDSNISRLRRRLGLKDAIKVRERCITVSRKYFGVDLWEARAALEAMRRRLCEPDVDPAELERIAAAVWNGRARQPFGEPRNDEAPCLAIARRNWALDHESLAQELARAWARVGRRDQGEAVLRRLDLRSLGPRSNDWE